MLSVLSSCLLALAVAQGVDPAAKAPATSQTQSEKLLDELIAKTKQLKSFTATYDFTVSKPGEAPDGEPCFHTRIDYQAPGKAHVDVDLGSIHVMEWLDGGVMTVRIEGDHALHARIDFPTVDADLGPIWHVLTDAFPDVGPPSVVVPAVIRMDWSFDEDDQKANFNVAVMFDLMARTPLGWLAVLRDRADPVSVTDKQLVLDSDGHFKVAISRDSGFIETLEGTSPNGTMHFRLDSLQRDIAIDSKCFEPPSDAPKGEDISDALRKQFVAHDVTDLRRSIYFRIAGNSSDTWSEPERTKIGAVLRAYHEFAMKDAFDLLRRAAKENRERVATWLKQRLDDGHSADEVASDRDGMIANLNVSLDKQRNDYSSALAVPEHSPPFPRSEELLKLEREVATKAFDELVRAPIVRDFEQATSLEKK